MNEPDNFGFYSDISTIFSDLILIFIILERFYSSAQFKQFKVTNTIKARNLFQPFRQSCFVYCLFGKYLCNPFFNWQRRYKAQSPVITLHTVTHEDIPHHLLHTSWPWPASRPKTASRSPQPGLLLGSEGEGEERR